MGRSLSLGIAVDEMFRGLWLWTSFLSMILHSHPGGPEGVNCLRPLPPAADLLQIRQQSSIVRLP